MELGILHQRLFFFHLKDNPLYMSIQVYTFIRFLLNVHYTCLFRPTRLFGMGEYKQKLSTPGPQVVRVPLVRIPLMRNIKMSAFV